MRKWKWEGVVQDFEEDLVEEIHEITQFKGKVNRGSFFVATLLTAILLSALSDRLLFGPKWLIITIPVVLLLPLYYAVLNARHRSTRILGLLITAVLTIAIVSSVVLLIIALFRHTENATQLLIDAALLWSANILTFAIWYFEIDRGGPIRRHAQIPDRPDLLFVQMASPTTGWENWMPTFSDYLFLAFNTSTAFSPTDTLALSRRIKSLMMAQSSLSLVIIAVLAARAINIA